MASICTKCIVSEDILNKRFYQLLDEHNLLEDAQDGFSQVHSTNRLFSKLKSLLSAQSSGRKLSVMLYLCNPLAP